MKTTRGFRIFVGKRAAVLAATPKTKLSTSSLAMRLVTFSDGSSERRVGVLVPVGPGPHTHVADVTAAAADASTPLHRGMRQLLIGPAAY